MKYSEAKEKYDWATISILVKHNGEHFSLSERNFNYGFCDCCGDYSMSGDMPVEKVVDLETMEVLYVREEE
jgi:hypothetical protein